MGNKVTLLLIGMALVFSAVCTDAAENGVRILFDQGHNQRFLIEENGELHLSKIAGIVRVAGADVYATKTELNDEVLKNVTALVISGPFESLRPEEVDAVVRFIEKGGRVAALLHIGPPLSGLLARLDVDHSNGVLHERTHVIDADINFRITGLSESPLFAGVSQFSVYGSWALNPGATVTTLAHTSAQSWVDLNGDKVLSKGDAVGEFAVVVSGSLGSGSFIVFADDAIFQNRYLGEQNSQLAANFAAWLTGR